MISRSYTVSFDGVEPKVIEIQCMITDGLPCFQIVGLPSKAVSEAKERVRAALNTIGLAIPPKRVVINLSPADVPKYGSHYDLPIALAILGALGSADISEVGRYFAMGELSLDGTLKPVLGALPAALAASEKEMSLFCPKECGAEAAWISKTRIYAANSLNECLKHLLGTSPITPSQPSEVKNSPSLLDLKDVKGQERAKRALEIAAAGGHHFLMLGAPGSGKSMLAARMPSILPPLDAKEALETSMIQSIAGQLNEEGIRRDRPFREPHHCASMAAITGGGLGAKPGEVSLAHNGVLFMDEFPEFPKAVLETLRQPIETKSITVSRASAHVTYPCNFMLLAASNPCRCGHMADASRACGRSPICSFDYLSKISGPLLDRFDLFVEFPPIDLADLDYAPSGEPSKIVAKRVQYARQIQKNRHKDLPNVTLNSSLDGQNLERVAKLDSDGKKLLRDGSAFYKLSARGHTRVLRVARTIADLEHSKGIETFHIAEALSYRLTIFDQNRKQKRQGSFRQTTHIH